MAGIDHHYRLGVGLAYVGAVVERRALDRRARGAWLRLDRGGERRRVGGNEIDDQLRRLAGLAGLCMRPLDFYRSGKVEHDA